MSPTMSRLFSSLQTKAQSALDRTGISAHLPTTHTQQAQQPPPANQPGSPEAADGPDGKPSRHRAIENITHSLRALHNQYAPQGPPEVRQLQVMITNSKGVALGFEGIGRDSKASSKDFYLWGQEQEDDVKDISDRLAYLNFVAGTLASSLSDDLDAARNPLKALRQAEQTLAPRRAQRKQIQQSIQTNRATGKPNIPQLEDQLLKQTRDDEPLEREAAVQRRKAVAESERLKWQAIREYGEKLTLLAQASEQILAQAPLAPPTPNAPYRGHKATADARNAVQSALDSWRPGMTAIPSLHPNQNADNRSFGETHASELSRVNSMSSNMTTQAQVGVAQTGHMTTPHPVQSYQLSDEKAQPSFSAFSPPPGPPPGHSTSAHMGSPPLDPMKLNNNPAPIPHTQSTASSAAGTPASVDATAGHHGPPVAALATPSQSHAHSTLPPSLAGHGAPSAQHTDSHLSTTATSGHEATATRILPTGAAESPVGAAPTGSLPPANLPGLATAPTVAETGVPIASGNEGPGPISGSLSRDATTASSSRAPAYGAGEDTYGSGGFRQDPSVRYESAEDEKRRLAREDRERILNAPLQSQAQQDEEIPVYSGGTGEYGDDKKSNYPDDKKGKGPPPPSGTPPPYA